MEDKTRKCSLKKHEEIEAICYCTKCEKFMCKKCEVFHSEFFDSKHKLFIIDSNNFDSIKYTKENENEIIKVEENIKYLKEFSNKLNEINKELKDELEKMNKNKEDIEIKIQRMFTKIRNALNKAEDDLLLDIENKFEKSNINKEIKKNDILLNKIKLSLNKEPNKYDLLINECKDIEMKNIYISELDKNIDINIPEEKEFEDILEKIKNLSNANKILFKSDIIKNDIKKQNLINEWIKEKLRKNSLKYELIYKMSVNGSNSKNFHKYCDNKGDTLTIIETEDNFIFGGFTTLDWKYNGKYDYSSNGFGNDIRYDKGKTTFLFSLNVMKKYDMFNRENIAIIIRKDLGPTFGNYDLYLNEDLKSGSITSTKESNFFELDILELTKAKGEEEKFYTKEIEVYKVF